jgi:hypothetical protein
MENLIVRGKLVKRQKISIQWESYILFVSSVCYHMYNCCIANSWRIQLGMPHCVRAFSSEAVIGLRTVQFWQLTEKLLIKFSFSNLACLPVNWYYSASTNYATVCPHHCSRHLNMDIGDMLVLVTSSCR